MKRNLLLSLPLLIGMVFLGACSSSDDGGETSSSEPSMTEMSNAVAMATAEAEAANGETSDTQTNDGSAVVDDIVVRKILSIGDSNTAGFGVGQPWPDKLELALGNPVLRRGINGETSADGVGRLPGLLSSENPTHVCIMYGTNDAIQGVPGSTTAGNIAAMVQLARAAGARVIVGSIPPILADNPTLQAARLDIDQQIPAAASAQGARVARVSEAMGEAIGLMQADGIHASDAGHAVIAQTFRDQF